MSSLSLVHRMLPGGANQPADVARRRLKVGLLVMILAVCLQTVPTLGRFGAPLAIVVRFVFWLVEMSLVVFVATLIYNRCLERRATSVMTLTTTLLSSAVVGSICVRIMAFIIEQHPWMARSNESLVGHTKPFLFGLFMGTLHCGVWALAFVYPYVIEDARHRALEADKLRIEAEQLRSAAELSRLRSQLEPHFLLNTLNAVAGLVTEDPREARRLLACLGDLLRDSLRDADEMQTIDDEVAWLRRYAEILESRHSGSLRFAWEIDQGAAGALVPRLLLQPLVENAVKHGALRRRTGGVVTVSARVEGGPEERRVRCFVEDNGPGVPNAEPRPGAFGLRSVRRRLELKFPDASLTIESSKRGTRSIVDLPCIHAKAGEA